MAKIDGAKILIIASNGFEQSELMVPLQQLKERGATVHVAAPDKAPIRGWKEKTWGDAITPDKILDEVKTADYDALVLPGGVINPDQLRRNKKALSLIKQFVDTGKVVAAICHAPWLLVEIDAVRGRNVTSFASIKTDVINAGGRWLDEEVVVDGPLITSRSPADLPAFVSKIVEKLQEGSRQR